VNSLFSFSPIIGSAAPRYLQATQDATRNCFAMTASNRGDTTMRKTILTLLATSLLAASSAQVAAAAEHHHARKAAPASEQFRNANNAVAWPAQPNWVSDYTEGHVISAPAGH
jgi:hypothetical protein